jgi:hypothetical protein
MFLAFDAPMGKATLIISGMILAAFHSARADVLVYPRRAEQSSVRYFKPDWKFIDLSFQNPAGPTGNLRFYFYESERRVAEKAVPLIRHSFDLLSKKFNYFPRRTVPYFLYNSYLEFLETNIFPVQVGTLGVTNPRDFKMALGFFGDRRLFNHVSTHELVHEFMAQKLASLEETSALTVGETSVQLPLWFVEGMAEYYSLDGLDQETEAMVRDFITHPDPEDGYQFRGFFDEGPFNFFGIYKLGQARCAFLEENYGKGVIQKILESFVKRDKSDFSQILLQVTGDDPILLSQKFEIWIKKRSYKEFLAATQYVTDFKNVPNLKGQIQATRSSHDGRIIAYRTAVPDTGEIRIYLTASTHPRKQLLLAADGKPGIESLHPDSFRNFDISTGSVVYVAQSKGKDLLYRQEVYLNNDGLQLGDTEIFDLRDSGILTADSPAISPDGRRIAFIGYNLDGQKDIYAFDIKDGMRSLKRLTEDIHSERNMSWGPQGILYTSDATETGHFNIFSVNPDDPSKRQRLTTDKRDHLDPMMMPDGRIFFVSFENARADILEIREGKILKKTNVDMGFSHLSPGLDGEILGLYFQSGEKRLVNIPKAALAGNSESKPRPDKIPEIPNHTLLNESFPLDQALDYNASKVENWEFGSTLVLLGGSARGIAGQAVTSVHDKLRNHIVGLNASFYGSWTLFDGQLTYINQERRVIWAAGPFQDIGFQSNISSDGTLRYSSYESFAGLMGGVRYPFSRFYYAQSNLALGWLRPFLTPTLETYLGEQGTPSGSTVLEEWRGANPGTRFQTELSLALGYNSLRYNAATGPISGGTALLEGIFDYLPQSGEGYTRARLDLERFFSISGAANFQLRGGTGTSFNYQTAREFFLASQYTLRPIPLGDEEYLMGRHFFYTTAEFQFPLSALLRLYIFEPEGVLGFDFGGVGQNGSDLWQRRVLGFVTGVNFTFFPFVLKLHFSKPISIGPKPPNNGDWVTHFALSYLYD